MPLPIDALTFKQALAPKDVLEWKVPLIKGTTTQEPAPFLLDNEDVASFTLTTTAEAAALGLQVKAGGGYGPSITDNVLLFWTSIAPAQQGAAIFETTDGAQLGVELVVTTNTTPPRVKSRIIIIRVRRL